MSFYKSRCAAPLCCPCSQASSHGVAWTCWQKVSMNAADPQIKKRGNCPGSVTQLCHPEENPSGFDRVCTASCAVSSLNSSSKRRHERNRRYPWPNHYYWEAAHACALIVRQTQLALCFGRDIDPLRTAVQQVAPRHPRLFAMKRPEKEALPF